MSSHVNTMHENEHSEYVLEFSKSECLLEYTSLVQVENCEWNIEPWQGKESPFNPEALLDGLNFIIGYSSTHDGLDICTILQSLGFPQRKSSSPKSIYSLGNEQVLVWLWSLGSTWGFCLDRLSVWGHELIYYKLIIVSDYEQYYSFK